MSIESARQQYSSAIDAAAQLFAARSNKAGRKCAAAIQSDRIGPIGVGSETRRLFKFCTRLGEPPPERPAGAPAALSGRSHESPAGRAQVPH